MLACLATKEWGWSKLNLRSIFLATYRLVLDYAGCAWLPFLSDTKLKKLDICQNKALRIITGQYHSAPVKALRLEAGVESYQTTSKKITAISREKADRVDHDHPRFMALKPNSNIPHRTSRQSWRKKSGELLAPLSHSNLPKIPLQKPEALPERTIEYYSPAANRNWIVHTELNLEGVVAPNNSDLFGDTSRPSFFDISPQPIPVQVENQSRVEKAIRVIDKHGGCVQAYTDGSCTAGIKNEGAAAVITRGSARNPTVIKTIRKQGKKYTCSYDEEMTAILLALEWIAQYFCMSAVIIPDSQSPLQAIENETPGTSKLQDHRVSGQSWLQGNSSMGD
jgi:hypothetical protein